ncbi:MAG: DUF2299 family protein [Candidatus Hodarchaeota archaeon]
MTDKDDPVLKKVKGLLMKEGLYISILPDQDNLKWSLKLMFPFKHPDSVPMILLKPKGENFVIIELKIKMNIAQSEHLKKKFKNSLDPLYQRMTRISLEQHVGLRILTKESPPRWILQERIYIDGLTDDRLMGALGKIYDVHRLIGTDLNGFANSPNIIFKFGGGPSPGTSIAP